MFVPRERETEREGEKERVFKRLARQANRTHPMRQVHKLQRYDLVLRILIKFDIIFAMKSALPNCQLTKLPNFSDKF